jgi:hypothetical protein
VVGRFAILIGVAATAGKVIASAFDQLSSAVASATEVQRQFAASLEAAGSAGSLSGAISEFKQLQNLADQTGKIIDQTVGKSVGEALGNALSGRPMQLFGRIADAYTGGSVTETLEGNEQEQRQQARRAFLASLQQQRIDAESLAAAGGDPSALDSAKRSQELRDRRKDFEVSLEGSGLTDQQSKQAREDLEATIAAEEAALAAAKRLESEKEITREKERQQKLESGTREGNVIGKQLAPGSFEGIEELERERERVSRDAEQKVKELERKAIVSVPVALNVTGLESIAQLESALGEIESKEIDVILNALGVDSVVEAKEAIKSLDESARTKIDQAREKQLTQEKERRSDFVQNTDLLEARASGDKAAEEAILRQQDLEKGQEATGSLEEATRFADAAAALRQQQGQASAGSFGASALQRVGGASTEFFRTDPRDPSEQQKKTNNLLADILREFKDKETLVLKSS